MSILRHGVAREVRTGLSLLTPEKHRRIFLLAAFLLLLAGPAWAGNPNCMAWKLDHPTQTSGCVTMTDTGQAIARSCDFQELLVASRAWANITTPGIASLNGMTGNRVEIERRWRAAIEACGK